MKVDRSAETAVSYTHLDVYKRQGQRGVRCLRWRAGRLRRRFPHRSGESHQAAGCVRSRRSGCRNRAHLLVRPPPRELALGPLRAWAAGIHRSHRPVRLHRPLRGPRQEHRPPEPPGASWQAEGRRHLRERERVSGCPDLPRSAICVGRAPPLPPSRATAPEPRCPLPASSFVAKTEVAYQITAGFLDPIPFLECVPGGLLVQLGPQCPWPPGWTQVYQLARPCAPVNRR